HVGERSLCPAFTGDFLRRQRRAPRGLQAQTPLACRPSTAVDPLAPGKILNVASGTHGHDRNLYVIASQPTFGTMQALGHTAHRRWHPTQIPAARTDVP